MHHSSLILASTSPYRRELLSRLRLPFEAVAPEVDETPDPLEAPESLASRLAAAKARAVAARHPDAIVIGSDQVAVLDGKILGKPATRGNTILQLRQSSGRTVQFFTAVCVARGATGDLRGEVDRCAVVFKNLADGQIERYVDAERPYDCAGGFKAEGLGIALFERIESEDPTGLIGLPLIRLVRLLESFGIRVI